jgi:type III pantothenate kinase
MNLVIDIGNTLTKIACFDNGEMIRMSRVDILTTQAADEWVHAFSVSKCIFSTVANNNTQLVEYLTKKIPFFIRLSHNLSFPFKILYHTPDTLGNDRIAAVAGAHNMFPGKNVLVIDLGTAITFDIITESAEYAGGNISPGMVARFKALHSFTSRLPLLENEELDTVLGNNTRTAIIAGVQQGIIFELLGYMDFFSRQYSDLKIILTGGDLDFFVNKLKKPIFVVPNLVLNGLNFILDYNAIKES